MLILFDAANLTFLLQLQSERKSSCCLQTVTDSQACIHLVRKREIKVTVNIFIIVLFFMLCWLPLNIIKTIKILCTTCSIPDNLITIGIILTHFNSALNPFLYAYHLKDFRHAILTMLGCRRRESSSLFWPLCWWSIVRSKQFVVRSTWHTAELVRREYETSENSRRAINRVINHQHSTHSQFHSYARRTRSENE